MATNGPLLTWVKGEPREEHRQLGLVIHHDDYLCAGHESFIGINVNTAKHPDYPDESAIGILSNSPGLLEQLQPHVSLRLACDGKVDRNTGREGPPFNIRVYTTESHKQTPQFMVEMINAVDHHITPVPDSVKKALAETYGLDKQQLFAKEKTAAQVAYAGTMLNSINRQTGQLFSQEITEHIAKFAITKDNLSRTEENRAARYGTEIPGSFEEIKQETKESFAKKILDKHQKKDNDPSKGL